MNRLFYGDNLDVLRQHVHAETVDLVYLDPPFNSNRSYNVIFNRHDVVADPDQAQIQAFDDTWKWSPVTEQQYVDYVSGELPTEVADALRAFHTLLGRNDAMAYLVNMAPRLVEMHRVLKPTGSLYLHCDPTMSHYLKVLLDAIFGADKFRGEITWLRTTTHNDAKRWSPNADILLYYGKSLSVTWNPAYTAHTDAYVASKYRFDDGDGRRYRLDNMTSPNPRPNLTYEWKGHQPPPNGWRYSRDRMAELDAAALIWYPDSKDKRLQFKRYLDEQEGVVIGNVWTDISPINSRAAERLGYPTQKPLRLLERIITASSNPDDVVLDPFCGCGTTVDSAQKLGRHWIGIDVTYIAVDLIEKRLKSTYGSDIDGTYEVLGIPRDQRAALALFGRSPFEFERWAVTLLNGRPNQRQVGDKGIDGVATFPLDGRGAVGRVLISVKGGRQLNPSMVRDLGGTVATQQAEMGVLITNGQPTPGMVDEANHAGVYQHPHYAQHFPRIQIVTVNQLLSGHIPLMPPTSDPYRRARRAVTSADQGSLFDPDSN